MRQRAAVLIGVKKTGGGLDILSAVQKGLEQMRQWALGQPGLLDAVGSPRIKMLSDESGTRIRAADISNAIQDFVDDGAIEQLFVYFAGHGANVRYSEYWLLSGAPDDANEAVNVAGSIPLARQCGIPHVVLISDACRTAAASTQAQAVQGSIIFPNAHPSVNPGCVDVFYATLVGKPALEVSDPNAPAEFDAVYTTELVKGLGGRAKAETEQDGGQPVRRVKPWPLKRYLESAVPDLLAGRRVSVTITQKPDAIITSEPEAWLSQLDVQDGIRRTTGSARAPRTPPLRGRRPATRAEAAWREPSGPTSPAPADPVGRGETLASASQRALRAALSETAPSSSASAAGARTRGRRQPTNEQGALFADMLERTGTELGPRRFESQCGFKVQGMALAEAVAPSGRIDIVSAEDGLVRLWDVHARGTNTLLVLRDGNGVLLPAIPQFIAVLTYDDGELANVSYEPSEHSNLWAELQYQLKELRAIRRVVAAAARLGVFRPEIIDDRMQFVDRMRRVKWLDPTMAVYAAYALHSLQQRDVIEEMQRDLRKAIHLSLFDVAMLARLPGTTEPWTTSDVFPAVPLLSQGWALLDAYRIELAGSLERRLHNHLESSLWTLFDRRGVDVLRAAIASGEIK